MRGRFVAYMNTRPIKNEADYDSALAKIDRLMGAEPGTPELLNWTYSFR